MSEQQYPQTFPDEEMLVAASQMPVFDDKGQVVNFGDIFRSSKTIVIFIRHFFCGMCQMYVSQLANVPKAALSDAGVHIALVGCGSWEPIGNYKKATGFTGDIYADPSRAVFRKLGMTNESLKGTPKGEKKRSYVTSVLSNVFKSVWEGPITTPHHIGKQGNISQNGGDFIFGPGNKCEFAYLMRHTQDHVEVTDLMKAAGVKYEG